MDRQISVIIPTRNRAALLERALGSVINQDLDEAIECVVSDNHSTDGTKMVVERIASQNPQIAWSYLSSDRQLPITTNWRRGVEASQGMFTKMLWDDDWMDPLCLRNLVTLARQHDASIVTCNSTTIDEAGNSVVVDYHPPAGQISFDEWLECAFNGATVLYSPTAALLKRESAIAGLEIAERLGDCASRGIGPDALMLYLAGALGERMWHSSSRLVYMWAGGDSISVATKSSQLTHCYRRALILLAELNTGQTPDSVLKRSNHWLAIDREFDQSLNALSLRSKFSVKLFGSDLARKACTRLSRWLSH